MNTIINDFGLIVTAGVPGSLEWIKTEHPKLMSCLQSLFWQAVAYNPPGHYIEDATQLFVDFGINDRSTRNSIIEACDFPFDYWKF